MGIYDCFCFWLELEATLPVDDDGEIRDGLMMESSKSIRNFLWYPIIFLNSSYPLNEVVGSPKIIAQYWRVLMMIWCSPKWWSIIMVFWYLHIWHRLGDCWQKLLVWIPAWHSWHCRGVRYFFGIFIFILVHSKLRKDKCLLYFKIII